MRVKGLVTSYKGLGEGERTGYLGARQSAFLTYVFADG